MFDELSSVHSLCGKILEFRCKDGEPSLAEGVIFEIRVYGNRATAIGF